MAITLQQVDDTTVDTLIDEAKLHARVCELGKILSREYAGKDLLLVCILRGGVMFLTDLMRQLSIPHNIDFMAVASYSDGVRASDGTVRITMDLLTDIQARNVLLVEDIVDSGHTLSHVLDMLNTRSPASLRVCSLLDKHDRRQVDVPIDYIGFQIPDKFVVGYGLDMDGYWRNLPFIGVVHEDSASQS